jgi:hypothetical protein
VTQIAPQRHKHGRQELDLLMAVIFCDVNL